MNTELCGRTLANYTLQWENGSLAALDRSCLDHQQCLLDTLTENNKAYMSSAGLVLGLSPILLSTIGPTISEVGVLSVRRPLLAAFVSLGAVGAYPTRVLSYSDDDPLSVLRTPTVLSHRVLEGIKTSNRRWRVVIIALQYIIVGLAVAHTALTSWQLGVSTTLNFVCHSSYMPIIWTTLPVLVHLPVAASMAVSVRRTIPKSSHHIMGELKLCLQHDPLPERSLQITMIRLWWRWVATMFAFIHTLVGIIIYSSLLFTMTTDAAIIVLRYFISAFVCRLILMFELAGMKWVHHQQRVAADGSDRTPHGDTGKLLPGGIERRDLGMELDYLPVAGGGR